MLKNDKRTKFEYKTIFLFNYDDSASKEEIKRIEDENSVYKGGLFSLHIFGVVICPKLNCKIADKHLTILELLNNSRVFLVRQYIFWRFLVKYFDS